MAVFHGETRLTWVFYKMELPRKEIGLFVIGKGNNFGRTSFNAHLLTRREKNLQLSFARVTNVLIVQCTIVGKTYMESPV